MEPDYTHKIKNMYVVPSDPTTCTFDNFEDDAEITDTSMDDIELAVQQGLQDRYERRVNVYKNSAGWPSSYAYYSEGETIPSEAAHLPVLRDERVTAPAYQAGTELLWLKLNEVGQDKLYYLLATGRAIWRGIYYDDFQLCWLKRPNEPAASEGHLVLENYVHKLPGSAKSVMAFLRRGRTKEEMQTCMNNMVRNGLMHHRVDTSFAAAMIQGMTNGCTAVHKLLEAIVSLIPALEIWERIPALAVFHVTSSTSSDCFSVSSSSLSSSSGSCCAPDAKCRKIDDSEKKSEKKRKAESTERRHHDTGTSKGSSQVHHQHVDLSVITREAVSGVSKYLFLVEIHSAGKTFDEAECKFLMEMIFVLQSQSQVFGLLFSKVMTILFSATKKDDDTITISRTEYRAFTLGPPRGSNDTFYVANFQKLVMDILTCMIHGITNIDA